MLRFLLRCLVLIILLAALSGAALWYWSATPIRGLSAEREMEIEPGMGLRRIAVAVSDATGASAWPFIALARLTGRSDRLQVGIYSIGPGMTPQAIINKMLKGDVVYANVSIIEGWTFAQMRAAIDAQPGLRHETAALSNAELLARLGINEAIAEGLFFPDTYRFPKGTRDAVIYRQARDAMRKQLDAVWAARAIGLPLNNPYQALILASIIEKETGRAEERRHVAAVFVNRLKIGMPLQTDPTVIYGLGPKFGGNLRKVDLVTDTPYNTYTRTGLPPSPIALPGRAALEAAVNPAPISALYFVARGDGSSHFSDDLATHNRAVNRYQRGRP